MSKFKRYERYKDSGVEWIGEIPEHWDVIKLKYVTKLVYGDSLPTENREEGEVDVFGSNGKVGTHNVANTLSPVIIVGRKGSYGKVTYSDKKCFAIDTTYYIDNRCTKSNIKWLYYSLMVLELDKNSQDTGVPGLSREYAYNKYVPVPTVNEQVAIANFLDQKTAEIDDLIFDIYTQIQKLREYRQSLISEAVTGKIDVREFQNKNEVIFRNE
ncbi:MAG: restriction endonuclease subunit S [Thermacetogeniaceae bacterium]